MPNSRAQKMPYLPFFSFKKKRGPARPVNQRSAALRAAPQPCPPIPPRARRPCAATPRCSAAPRAAPQPCPPTSRPPSRATRPPRRFPPRRSPPRRHRAHCRDAPLAVPSPRRSPPRRRDARLRRGPSRGRAHPSLRATAVPTHASIATRPPRRLPPASRCDARRCDATALTAATAYSSRRHRDARRRDAAMLGCAAGRSAAVPTHPSAPRPCPTSLPSRRARRGAFRRDARRRDATALTVATPHSSRCRRGARRRHAAMLGCAAGRAAAVPTHLSIATRLPRRFPPRRSPP